jgi:prepilin-type N-terminal cleavage/methylation domain-containing protein
MIQPRQPTRPRSGLSLLEVLVALSIFLLSLSALSHLVRFAGDRAVEIDQRSQAAQLCQSKMNEVLAGAIPLSGQSDTFDEAPEYTWTVSADANGVPNLYDVTVTVSRDRPDGTRIEVSLGQMVLDPAAIGSTQDATAISGSDTANNASGSTPSSSGSTTPTSPTSGATAAGAAGTAPKTSTQPTTGGAGGTAPKSGGTTTPPSTGTTAPKTTTPSPSPSPSPAPKTTTPAPSPSPSPAPKTKG